MPTEVSINDRRREMGLPPHRHFFRLVFRKHTIMYKFECEGCGETAFKYKFGYWLPINHIAVRFLKPKNLDD